MPLDMSESILMYSLIIKKSPLDRYVIIPHSFVFNLYCLCEGQPAMLVFALRELASWLISGNVYMLVTIAFASIGVVYIEMDANTRYFEY